MKMNLYRVLGCVLSLGGLSMTLPSAAQSLSNTTTTITLTDPCFSIPSGAYTLTLNYVDQDNGPTGDINYSVTVNDSGSIMVITIPTATLPTIAVNGWDLSGTGGKIQLSSSTDNGLLFWDNDYFNCTPLGINNHQGLSFNLISGKIAARVMIAEAIKTRKIPSFLSGQMPL
ncbi:MAG TPA: hypothetical protein VL832_20650 [Puia sp.]|nr:hypothetical protein [Puia sp.]